MTLRCLAGGSYIYIALAYFVSVSTFYYVMEEALRVINDFLRLHFPHVNPDRLWICRKGLGAEIVLYLFAQEVWMESLFG
jgi:hypothetical protein